MIDKMDIAVLPNRHSRSRSNLGLQPATPALF
jgi:hypothetical protein